MNNSINVSVQLFSHFWVYLSEPFQEKRSHDKWTVLNSSVALLNYFVTMNCICRNRRMISDHITKKTILHDVSPAYVGEISAPLERCSYVHLLRLGMSWSLQPGWPTTLIAALQFCIYSWLTTIVMDATLQWLFLFQVDCVCNYTKLKLLLL